jgi:hypothetical protein
MSKNLSMDIVRLLADFENAHDMGELDSLHWDVLIAVMDAQKTGNSITNQSLVDLKFTSRSSTYRKIADMRKLGILVEKWDKGTCMLELGPKAEDFFSEAGVALQKLVKDAQG